MTEYVSQNAAGRSPAVDLPDVAKSAGWLAEWVLDRPISREAEDNAETVTAFLRRLTMPCPDFCQTNHVANFEIEQELRMRNHEVALPPIRDGERTVASVSVVVNDDLTTGERTKPVVMTEVGDGLTPAQTREYTDQLVVAQALAATGSSAALAPAAEIAEEELRRQDHAAFRASLGEDTGLFDEAKQKTPCPDWCVIDHTKQYEEYVRECSTGGEEIPALSGGTVSASVVQFTDFLSGTRKAPEVRVGDLTITPENAIALAEQIRNAAISALAPMLIRNENRGADCATWCVHHEGGCDGECMGNPTDVLASAGYKAYTDGGGIRVGLAESYPIITEDRKPAVCVKVSGPRSLDVDKEAWVEMTPAEARQHAAAILRHADTAESA
ncbi:DUF6907 domain-containing protein [Plantactinospora solaniradicis]|uniref:DUF6907 domain-containing protein n=1 Tax=Plantactinospora solaniradicis TaxID=1723736 RepID=A0ABW1K8M7_9ACTN